MESKDRYKKFNNNEIPTHIGFMVLLVFGSLIAWFTIHIGEKIIQNAPSSKAFSENKQLQQEIDNTK